MSNFTFSHNVFYERCIFKSFNSRISVVACSFFKTGTVSIWYIREWVKPQNTWLEVDRHSDRGVLNMRNHISFRANSPVGFITLLRTFDGETRKLLLGLHSLIRFLFNFFPHNRILDWPKLKLFARYYSNDDTIFFS